jgi:hypothetical protein
MGHAETPKIPEVTDEAGDSPKWLPALGAVLFVLAVGSLLYTHLVSDDTGGSDAPVAADAPSH